MKKGSLGSVSRFFRNLLKTGDTALKGSVRTSATLTFQPLGHGFYRCNQSGEVTKKPKTYARKFSRKYINGEMFHPGKNPKQWSAVAWLENSVKCPNCHQDNRTTTPKTHCKFCGIDFSLIIPRIVYATDKDGYRWSRCDGEKFYRCPDCRKITHDDDEEHTCSCGAVLKLIPYNY